MRKSGLTAALAALLLLLTACGGPEGGAGRDVDPIALGERLCQQAQDLPAMDTVTSDGADGEGLFRYLSDLSYDRVAGYYFAYARGGTAEEIAVIRLKDSGDGAQARASLERHLEDRLGIFRVYDPEQVAAVEQGQIVVAGDLVALLVCQNAGQLAQAVRQEAAG